MPLSQSSPGSLVSWGEEDRINLEFDTAFQVLLFVMVTGSNPFSNILEALEGNLIFPRDTSLSEV